MNRSKQFVRGFTLIAVLASGAGALATFASAADATLPNSMKMSGEMQTPQTAAEYRAAADQYDQEAAELDTVAKQHAQMAALYRSRAIPGSKQYESYFALANHCDNLANLHRKSAAEARATAQLHRDMANKGI